MDYDFGSDFDLGSFEDIDLSGLGDIDLSGLEDLDLSGLEGMDLSGLEGLDLDSIAELGIGDFDLSGLTDGGGSSLDQIIGGEGADDLDELLRSMGDQGREGMEDLDLGDARVLAEMGDGAGSSGSGLTRGLKFSGAGESGDGLGLKTVTGRGEIAYVDPETGATGLKSEFFRDMNDLQKTGTPEQIARYELQKDRTIKTFSKPPRAKALTLMQLAARA